MTPSSSTATKAEADNDASHATTDGNDEQQRARIN